MAERILLGLTIFALLGIWGELVSIKNVLENIYLVYKNERSNKKWKRG